LRVDFYAAAIDSPVPGSGFFVQSGQACDASFSQALAAEETDLDLGLVQPTAVLRAFSLMV
jgi:hypothetical protein